MQVLYMKYEKCTREKVKVAGVLGFSAVHFVISGEGYFNGRKIRAGQGFTAFENQFAEYYPNSDDPWSYVWIRITGDDTLRKYGEIFTWKCENKSNLIKTAQQGEQGNELYRLGSAYMLLSYIENDNRRLSAEQKHIIDAENYIKAYYKEINSAQQVADRLGLSRAYLRNLFYEQKGMSTKEYIIKIRLEQACNMLLSDYAIKTVALSVGYEDQLQFSKIFKKYMGISPTEYRKRKGR